MHIDELAADRDRNSEQASQSHGQRYLHHHCEVQSQKVSQG